MRRELGEGRWDKILIRRMTELSVADNYNEAKDEWIATGDVWWNGNGDIPDWVANSSHPNQCLCGHPIVYHFRIRNTENGVEEIVGSDHINSYLIMRQIAEEKGLVIGEVTDEQVAEWIKVRVGSMKAEAWWAENGDSFKLMFDKIKELDLWLNAYRQDWVFNTALQRSEQRRVLRKKGKGQFGTRTYKMASIVWRWNHPDNPKNQFTVHGYPNARLMQDLAYLYVTSEPLLEKFNKWKTEREQRKNEVIAKRQERIRIRQEREARIEARRKEEERIYNLPENVEKRRKAELMRQEEERIRKEEEDRRLAERHATLRRKYLRLTKAPVSETYAKNCDFLGMPILTGRVCDPDSGSQIELRALYTFMSHCSEKEVDGIQWLLQCRTFLQRPPTKEQLEILTRLGIDSTGLNRIEAERLIQEEEPINVKF